MLTDTNIKYSAAKRVAGCAPKRGGEAMCPALTWDSFEVSVDDSAVALGPLTRRPWSNAEYSSLAGSTPSHAMSHPPPNITAYRDRSSPSDLNGMGCTIGPVYWILYGTMSQQTPECSYGGYYIAHEGGGAGLAGIGLGPVGLRRASEGGDDPFPHLRTVAYYATPLIRYRPQ